MGSNVMKMLTSYQLFDSGTPEQIKESREQNDGKIILRGLIQRADALNQNSRVYPRHILEREVRNYQKLIRENRALGECVPPGTEIMTRDGWRAIETVKVGDFVATLNMHTEEIEYQRVSHKTDKPYTGKLLNIKNNRSFDMLVTPDHNVVMWNRAGQPLKMRASELAERHARRDSTLSHSGLKRTGIWRGEDVGTVTVPGLGVVKADMALDNRFMSVEEVDYDGRVYCVTVPNGTWMMRYNGKTCWTGNCDHPDSSTISLANVSHIMREVRMENDAVYGAVELLDTPKGKIAQSLVESGVKLGISSRGVGSTRKQGDVTVVEDDFILLCFDLVSDPSTVGAFVLPEGRDISRTDLNKILNRSDRINRLVNDILYR